MPALRPKPTRARTKIAVAMPGVRRALGKRDQRERAAGRTEQGEQGEQAQRRRRGSRPGRSSRLRGPPASSSSVVTRKNADSAMISQPNRNRMLLRAITTSAMPAVSSAVEQPQLAAVLRMLRLLPVAQAVDVAQQRDQEDRQRKMADSPSTATLNSAPGSGPRQRRSAGCARHARRRRPRPVRDRPPPPSGAVVSHCPRRGVPAEKQAGKPLDAARTIPRSTSTSLMTLPTRCEWTPRPGPARP